MLNQVIAMRDKRETGMRLDSCPKGYVFLNDSKCVSCSGGVSEHSRAQEGPGTPERQLRYGSSNVDACSVSP